MLQIGILNPAVSSLLCRVRHTNTLVIADYAFPYWPQIETVDLALVRDIPTVLEVLRAIRGTFHAGKAYMAEEFHAANSDEIRDRFAKELAGIPLTLEPHLDFKKRVPHAIGLIRTGDTVPYGNIILESA